MGEDSRESCKVVYLAFFAYIFSTPTLHLALTSSNLLQVMLVLFCPYFLHAFYPLSEGWLPGVYRQRSTMYQQLQTYLKELPSHWPLLRRAQEFVTPLRLSLLLGWIFVISVSWVGMAFVIESYRYPGYLKQFGIDIMWLSACSLVTCFWFYLHPTAKSVAAEPVKWLEHFLKIALSAYFFVWGLLIMQTLFGFGFFFTQLTFPVVVYTMAGLYLGGLVLLGLTAPLYRKHHSCLMRPEVLVVLLVSSCLLFSQFYATLDLFRDRLTRAKNLLKLTYLEREKSLWGVQVDHYLFINEITPPQARIMHPPQKYPWPESGNQFVIRRWLYPRTLVAPEYASQSATTMTHYVVDNAEAESNHLFMFPGWPTKILPQASVGFLREVRTDVNIESSSFPIVEPTYPYFELTHPDKSVASVSAKTNTWEAHHTTRWQTPSYLWLGRLPQGTNPSVMVITQRAHSVRLVLRDARNPDAVLLGAANLSVGSSEQLAVHDISKRLANLAKTQPLSGEWLVGLEVGPFASAPYALNKGIVGLENFHASDCPRQPCLFEIETAIFEGKWPQAEQLLLPLEPSMAEDGYYWQLRQIVAEKLAQTKAAQTYQSLAARYWIGSNEFNFPLWQIDNPGKKSE
jgi:hypothetical protein